MEQFFMVLLLISAVSIIVLEIIQAGKAESASAAFSGGSSDLFSQVKERGSEKMLSRITMSVGLIFIVIAFVMTSIL